MKRFIFCIFLITATIPLALHAEEAPAKPQKTKKSKWTDKISFYGDIRYRFEFFQEAAQDSRNRHRLRARIGLKAKPHKSIDLNIRLATGNALNPVSTNHTLDGGFTKKTVNLDLAYFDWHPAFLRDTHVVGGKIKTPFYRPLKNQIIWDSDLTPEGLAISHSTTIKSVNIFINTAALFVEERSDSDDTWLFGGQAGIKYNFLNDHAYVLGSIGYFLYTDNLGNAPLAANAAGNTTDGAGNYTKNYGLLEAIGEVGYKADPYKIAIFGEYVRNTRSNTNNKAIIGGLKASRKFGKQELSLLYDYRHLESDAVLGAFTDSDFSGGGTDGKGHKFNLGLKINKYAALAATYFLNTTTITNTANYHRIQLDAKFTFK